MTRETSDYQNEERQVDVTLGTIKRLLMFGSDHYNTAMVEGQRHIASYWDGYTRALKHVLEAEHE